jgi:hypothetical protein
VHPSLHSHDADDEVVACLPNLLGVEGEFIPGPEEVDREAAKAPESKVRRFGEDAARDRVVLDLGIEQLA